jgi:primosomal protein N' (replication factor Y)
MLPTILHIAVATPLRKTFDYLLTSEQDVLSLKKGMRVLVPWQRREIVGVIMGIDQHSNLAISQLRPIIKILDVEPVLDESLLVLARWASDYYQHPIGDVVFQMLPILLRKDHPLKDERNFVWQLNREIAPIPWGRAKKQQALYEYLQQQERGCSPSQLIEAGFSKDIIQALAEKNSIQKIFSKPYYTNDVKQTGPVLNEEQQTAIETILQSLGKFKPFVLEGVTGSGKTEVYLQCIARALQQGLQVLVLVPEIGLTPQTLSRFSQRFDTHMVILHSDLTDKERYLNWQATAVGEARLVIGTRSAIFTSFSQLGLIIIDECHDASFKQQDTFRYSARDLAIMRAKQLNIPVVLGSATPSFETLVNIERARYERLKLTKRAGLAKPPTFELIDIRRQALYAGIAPRVIERIKEQVEAGSQVLLFLNRRGFAPTLICHDCGWLAGCKRCDARMTIHLSSNRLHCHHCHDTQLIIKRCPKCHTDNVLPMGLGTERIEQHLKEVFPQYGLCRIDRDSTQAKGALDKMLQHIHDGKHQILLGTQMLAKGHHFPKVTLVVVINADHGFFSADFRSSERMAQLIIQVAGRAGREEQPGKVIIQTRNPEHPALQRLLQQGYAGFAQQELIERQSAQLPPFSYQALLRADSHKPTAAEEFLTTAKQLATTPELQILGPIPAPMSKRAGRYRAQLLLQAPQRAILQSHLRQLIEKIETKKLGTNIHWSVDVDPIDTY